MPSVASVLKKRRARPNPSVTNTTSSANTDRSAAHRKAVKAGKLVETTNDLSIQDFIASFAPGNLLDHLKKYPFEYSQSSSLTLRCLNSSDMSVSLINTCLGLVEGTSKADYEASEIGWSRVKKREEMLLPDLKYLILADVSDSDNVIGFMSFMVTYEDGLEVLYVYEIHFTLGHQGRGHGKEFMAWAYDIGLKIGLEKIMLTVFRQNAHAESWYRRLGYAVDECSPKDRVFRDGTVKKSTYVILSKSLKQPPHLIKSA